MFEPTGVWSGRRQTGAGRSQSRAVSQARRTGVRTFVGVSARHSAMRGDEVARAGLGMKPHGRRERQKGRGEQRRAGQGSVSQSVQHVGFTMGAGGIVFLLPAWRTPAP